MYVASSETKQFRLLHCSFAAASKWFYVSILEGMTYVVTVGKCPIEYACRNYRDGPFNVHKLFETGPIKI